MSIFSKEMILTNYISYDKNECLEELSNLFFKNGIVTDKKVFYETILERENLVTTGMGMGIAIPHARTNVVSELKILVCLLDNELDFNSLDGKPVKIIFMLGVPENLATEYMQVLAVVSRFLGAKKNRDELLEAKNLDEVYGIIGRIESEIKI